MINLTEQVKIGAEVTVQEMESILNLMASFIGNVQKMGSVMPATVRIGGQSIKMTDLLSAYGKMENAFGKE